MFFGYSSVEDFLNLLFKGVNNEVILKWFIPVILGLNFLFDFLFASVGGIWFLIILYCVDFLTGFAKSIYYSRIIYNLKKQNKEVSEDLENKKLVSKKFPRFLFTLLAALLILTLIKFAGEYSIIFMPLFSIFYSVFLGQQLISIVENLSEMNLIPLNIVEKLKRKITDFFENDNK